MALFDRNFPSRDDEHTSPWAVAAVAAAAGLLAGIAYLLTRPRTYVAVSTRAHASDGTVLPTTCTCLDGVLCRIAVRNTASQSLRESSDVSPSEVSTTVPVVAKEVCLHIRIEDGDFDSVPQYEDGRPAAHVRSGRELIVFLGDMQPSKEVELHVRVRVGG